MARNLEDTTIVERAIPIRDLQCARALVSYIEEGWEAWGFHSRPDIATEAGNPSIAVILTAPRIDANRLVEIGRAFRRGWFAARMYQG